MNKILSAILVVAIVGAVGALGYVIATPKSGPGFTEFYILNMEGRTTNYPSVVALGEEGEVMVGIINREHETVSYRVEVMMDGISEDKAGPITLAYNEKWERAVSFTPNELGVARKVELILYKNKETEPYLKPLYLLVGVRVPVVIP